MIKVLTIGAITQDIIFEYQEDLDSLVIKNGVPHIAFKEGSKIELEKLHFAAGGGAVNSAVSFARLGCQVTTIFKRGDDATGHGIQEALEKYGITVHACVSKKEKTGISFIIPSPKKDRVIFTYRGANQLLTKKDIPNFCFDQTDCVYITSLSHKAADILPHIAHLAQTKIAGLGLKVAVNPGISQLTTNSAPLRAALNSIDILIMNSEEMGLFMATLKPRFFKSSGDGLIFDGPPLTRKVLSVGDITFTLQEYITEILSYGVKRVVVTDGKEGVYIATKDHLFYHPAISVDVVNTVGAGDAFGSCFVACLLQGFSIENAIRAGVINAASVIMDYDAQSNLVNLHEMKQFLENFDNNLLQVFSL